MPCVARRGLVAVDRVGLTDGLGEEAQAPLLDVDAVARQYVPDMAFVYHDRGRSLKAQATWYMVTTQAPPRPRLCWRAMRAPSTWRWSAWPRTCHTSSVHCARPVAPSGCPLDNRPPDGLTTTL